MKPTLALATCLAALPLATSNADIVINEVLYDAEPNTQCNEFIELHNTGPAEVDLSGWAFSAGIDFTFPGGTTFPAGGYLVVAQDPPTMLADHNVQALGPWVGGLRNEGETIRLRDATGTVVDEVTYNDSFPWPVGALSTGRSMELINPALDNDLGSSWRQAGALVDETETTTFLAPGAEGWSYRKGESEASDPVEEWRQVDFIEDGSWLLGQTPIGYGDGDDTTELNDMQNGYSSVYMRREFEIDPGDVPQQLVVRVYVDDGAVVWINGTEVARVSVAGGQLPFDGSAINHERAWEEVTVANAGAFLIEGTNLVAVHGLNQGIGSSDFSLDIELKTPEPGSSEPQPSPGARNSAFANNAPPHIRQVDHSPKQPLSSEATTIAAKVTDPDGVASVVLEYQVVAPGAYIPALLAKPQATLLSDPNGPRTPNPAYEDPANWNSITMTANGEIYSATIPAQPNRSLVRYRITIADTPGASVRVPYADDPSLNFAYYSYDGIPDFVADTRSVTGQVPFTHSKEVLESLPVYSMLTTQADYDQCVAYSANQISGGNADARSAFNWSGTFIYDGVVYDNIGYRLRQRNARYSGSGKRSFRFRFNDGQYIQLHDDNGDPYPTKWRSLNTHKMLGSRGGVNFGLYEAANSVLWNAIGSPAPRTNWFHFRVVKTAAEQPSVAGGQHLGDFYGLLIALEDYDVRFLESHNLERGNLYKLKTGGNNGKSVQRYQAKDAVDDASDFTTIINQLRNTQSDSWLRDHVDWDAYYNYKVVVDAVRTYDVSNGITSNNGEHLKNRTYYFEPSPGNPLGLLNMMPWDSDTSWGPNYNGGWDWPKNAIDDREEFNKEYKNAVREFRDLVWQEDQIEPLLDRFLDKLEDFQLADRDRWTGGPNPGQQSDGPIANRVAEMKRFAFDGGSWSGGNDGQRDFIYDAGGNVIASDTISKDSGVSGQEGRDAYLDALAFDPSIPAKPTISYTGDANYPTDGLAFSASQFSDPQGSATATSIEWRLAEITPPDGGAIQILAAGSDWRYLDNGSDQGADWRASIFDDSSWGNGAAPLGYGGINGLPGQQVTTTVSKTNPEGQRFVTTYFRGSVAIDDPTQFSRFTFKLHIDDAAVVFVNGVEVVRDGFNELTEVNYDTLADSSGNEGTFDEFEISPSFFVSGENTIAIELHQRDIGSSDLVFDLALDATPLSPELLFEVQADWESGEFDPAQTSIDIPTTIARENRLYRARVRYLDNSGRWSHWSDPHEFTTSLPDIQPLLDNLVVSEIMYHPADPSAAEINAGFTDADDFEFVEVYNASSSETLSLTGVRFTKGIDFDFAPGTALAPGAAIVVPRNQAAFELRYGAGIAIGAEYGTNPEGKLSNSGERLKLSYAGGTPIRDFDYDDSPPWPTAPDGTGASLELVAPESVPDHALPSSWLSSPVGGTPGTPAVGTTFTDFLASFGIADSNPDLDSDGDGLSNFIEFALAGDPAAGNSPERPTASTTQIDGDDYLSITFGRPANASGLTHTVEFSSDLAVWITGGVLLSSVPGENATVIEAWRSSSPIPPDGKLFARLRVSQ